MILMCAAMLHAVPIQRALSNLPLHARSNVTPDDVTKALQQLIYSKAQAVAHTDLTVI